MEEQIRAKFLALHPVMDERVTRLWAGAEAAALGDGGIAIVGRATGLSRTTIRAGRDELRAGGRVAAISPVERDQLSRHLGFYRSDKAVQKGSPEPSPEPTARERA